MKFLILFLILIPSLSFASIPDYCKEETDGEEAYKFSLEIIEVFKNNDLKRLSEMTLTLYGNGNINNFDLSNKNITDVFNVEMVDDLVSRAEPICERYNYEGYSFGWGIWFEFLGLNDENCEMKMTPKIVALNEGVKEEFQISPEDIIINKENNNSSNCE